MARKSASGIGAAKERLILHHLRLVLKVANSFSGSRCEFEEFVSVGVLSLINASDKFNPEIGVHFGVYAQKSISNSILKYLKQRSKHYANIVSPEQTKKLPNRGQQINECEMKDEIDKVKKLVNELSIRQQFVLEKRYPSDGSDPLSLKEIGEKLNISGRRAGQIQQETLQELRKAFNY